jgi:hypothetical protein
MQDSNPKAVGIGDVVADELRDIAYRRGENPAGLDPGKTWQRRCLDQRLFGISISGGGIRSATFALGILQGLAEKNLLQKADYLSTVSGGGYIGSWLMGILARGPQCYESLKPHVPLSASRDPITFLRKYSNYLAPRLGISLDVLVIPLIWFRNVALNQTIIISALAALFVLALAPGATLGMLIGQGDGCASLVSLVLCVLFSGIAVWKIGFNLRHAVKREVDNQPTATNDAGEDASRIRWWIAVPLFCAALLLVCALAPQKAAVLTPDNGSIIGFLLLWLLHALLQWRGSFVPSYRRRKKTLGAKSLLVAPWFHIVWMSMVSAALSIFLVHGVAVLSKRWALLPGGGFHIAAWAPPLYLISIVAGVGLQIGLMGQDFPDSGREWLVRLGALLLTISAVWAGLYAVAVFAPLGLARLWLAGRTYVVSSGGIVWALSTIMSVIAGRSARTGTPAQQQPKGISVTDLLARFGPIVAIAGFLIGVALAVQVTLFLLLTQDLAHYLKFFVRHYWETLSSITYRPGTPLVLFIVAVAIFLILSVRVNINEFSMHQFYRNRLVRCYLGASAARQREPNAFTGFDPQDDIPLHELALDVPLNGRLRTPYPIVNATLTVTAGSELATQERKALPWFFTPRFSGFFPAHLDRRRSQQDQPVLASTYVKTEDMMENGVRLGTAMAISGAAVNPGMGYHTSAQTAFLLTLFNVRLGWWVGNPENPRTYTRSGPRVALLWLFRELLGFVDEDSAYLNLSDGGNFENLGLYELVRRRCRYLIVVDGEEDAEYTFQSLGGAVRKCRTDFGVEIEIDPQVIRAKDPFSKSHCVIGHVHYPEGETGLLLYLKSSMTGDEPADVEEYRRTFKEFPQQSTIDQFFSESQFEAYRRLGLHVARTALDHCTPVMTIDEAFQRLLTQWEIPPATPEGASTRQSDAYSRLIGILAATPNLKNLDPTLIKNFPGVAFASDDERRGYFLYLDLLQLIENVFLDLDFANAHKWGHPGNAGWHTVISYWAQQKPIKAIWKDQRESYAKPFRQFFDDLVAGNQN